MLLKEITKLDSVGEFNAMKKAEQIDIMMKLGEYLHREHNNDHEIFLKIHNIFGTGPTIQRCFEDGLVGLTKVELSDKFLLLIDLFNLTLM